MTTKFILLRFFNTYDRLFAVRAHLEIHDFELCLPDNIEIRYIEPLMKSTQATILVVDRKTTLVMEIRDDSRTSFDEAIGLSNYSNSKAGVLSYVSIFENLWKQIELYEEVKKSHKQLEIHDKMQQEFINIAAHELKTPIQPILGLTEILTIGAELGLDNCVVFEELVRKNILRPEDQSMRSENGQFLCFPIHRFHPSLLL